MKLNSNKVAFVFLMVLALMCVGCGKQQFKTGLFAPYENKSSVGPTGMAWNGRDLLVGALGQTIHVRDVRTRSLYFIPAFFDPVVYYTDSRYPFQIPGNPHICGLAWEGACCENGYLWIADTNNKRIVKLDYYHNLVLSFPSPGDIPNGLTFDGYSLWVADAESSLIYKISTVDGRILKTIASPIENPSGLAWDYKDLWVVGRNNCTRDQGHCYSSRLLKVAVEHGMVTHEIRLPEEIQHPTSLEWVDGTLWVGDSRLNRVFRIPDIKALPVK